MHLSQLYDACCGRECGLQMYIGVEQNGGKYSQVEEYS